MTWASVSSRFLSFTIVIPLLFHRLSAPEIAVWYLFSTILGLQTVADAGFAPTFARSVAFVMGGADHVGDLRESTQTRGAPNWTLLARVRATLDVVYWRLTLGALAVIGVAGSFGVIRPIAALSDHRSGWIAWGVVLLTTAIALRGNFYSAYLQGMNQVALVRRWEAVMSICAILSIFAVLLAGGRLVALSLSNMVWTFAGVVRDWQLARALPLPTEATSAAHVLDRDVLRQVWPRAWRSGLGIGASRGLQYASGIVYAQIAPAAAAASYLIALRFVQVISELSQAPFYSKIPVLARLYSERKTDDMLSLAERGLRLAYWTFLAGVLALGLGAAPALHLVRSNVEFASPLLWALLALAYFVERFGAMHLQMYSLTNHIVWHIANGVTGVVMIVVTALMLPRLGVYAFPLGMLVAYLAFYSWWSAKLAIRAFAIDAMRFEARTAAVPLLILLLFGVGVTLRG